MLTAPEVSAELIADGIHVDEIAMKVLLQAKGAQGVVLISDGISATGMNRTSPRSCRDAALLRLEHAYS